MILFFKEGKKIFSFRPLKRITADIFYIQSDIFYIQIFENYFCFVVYCFIICVCICIMGCVYLSAPQHSQRKEYIKTLKYLCSQVHNSTTCYFCKNKNSLYVLQHIVTNNLYDSLLQIVV